MEGALESRHILELLRESDACLVLNLVCVPDTLVDGQMSLTSRDDGKLLVGQIILLRLLLLLNDKCICDVVVAI